jgi:trk system potassium uptake protein TrkA
MNIIVCGAGEVGKHVAEALDAAGNNVTVIDIDPDRLRAIEETMEVRTLAGNCASAEVLIEAGAETADLVIAAASHDEANLLCASVATGLGAERSIARVHNPDYFEQRGLDYESHLGIDLLISPEYATAHAIARALRNPGGLAIEEFARGKIEMLEFDVGERTPAAGRRLADAGLPGGARLVAITRESRAFLPEATSVVVGGDTVVLVANAEVFSQARKLYQDGPAGRAKVVIMGGTPMAVTLCKALKDRGFSIRLFESDRRRAQDLSEELDWVTVLQGDPTERSVFEEEHLEQADAFVAMDDDDERNILACAWAKSMDVKTAMAIVERPNYLHLLTFVGIDRPYSPRLVAVKEIQEALDQTPLRRLASVAEGQVDVFRVRVTSAALNVINKALRDTGLSPEWMIAAIQHGRDVRVPGPDDTIRPGDVVLVVGRHGQEKSLRRLFGL